MMGIVKTTMNILCRRFLITLALAATLTACSTAPEKPLDEEAGIVRAEPPSATNDYPTRDRVEYVLNCIAQHGGLTYVNQYACGCKIDKIAEKMSFADYEAAKTFTHLRSTPGEAGGVFRDPAQSKDLRKRMKEAESFAEKNCFVSKTTDIKRPPAAK
jgi:hypothetical protein